MRLVALQLRFLPDGDGLKVCTPTSERPLARLVPDKVCPQMWRVVRPDGGLSGLLNRARAKDMAFGLAESALFTGEARRAARAEAA